MGSYKSVETVGSIEVNICIPIWGLYDPRIKQLVYYGDTRKNCIENKFQSWEKIVDKREALISKSNYWICNKWKMRVYHCPVCGLWHLTKLQR